MMKSKNKIFILVLGIIFLAAVSTTLMNKSGDTSESENYQGPKVIIGNAEVKTEVADTPELQMKGLSGRTVLGESEGMLFMFPEPQEGWFWMKDMIIPIDIIWIRDGKVQGFAENIPPPAPDTPDEFLETYPSPDLIDMALEVSAGFTAANGIKIGDSVRVEGIKE